MITLIAAVAQNGCIGKNGALPWRIPEHMKHFKELTIGHVVVMGRKTWESIPKKFRPLPNRTNIVVTRQTDYIVPDGVETYPSIDDACAAHATATIFIIGGSEIYKQTIDKADRLEITEVAQHVDGDVFFPTIDPKIWKETKREPHDGFTFVTYGRR